MDIIFKIFLNKLRKFKKEMGPLSFKFWAKVTYRNPTMDLLQLNQFEIIICFLKI
jgi:hypothetical protein